MPICLSCARLGKGQKSCSKCLTLKSLTLYEKKEAAKNSLARSWASERDLDDIRLVKSMTRLRSVAI